MASDMSRKRDAPRLKMQSSPVRERRLAMLGPRKIDDIGSHKVGTTPVTKRSAGPRSHRGRLRYWKGRLVESTFCLVLVIEASAGSAEEFMVSKILLVSFSNVPSFSGAYVIGAGSHGDVFA